MRKLVTIRKIKKLLPITGADFIELAMVDDWSVVVKKGEFIEGSLCVFFEIDSMLPDEPRYSFLGTPKDYLGVPRHRLKTMKLRKVLSQGLALPLSSFPEVYIQDCSEDGDLSNLLNVVKYEPELTTGYSSKKSGDGNNNTQIKFPSFIPKTDQERIQNLPYYYELYKDHMWEETLKLDGSSLTAFKVVVELTTWQKVKQWFGFKQSASRFGVCSRNLELNRGDSEFWKIALKNNLDKLLPVGYAVQGELIGTKIQNNWEKVSENQFWVFDIFDIEEQRYLLPKERKDFMEYYLQGVNHVPVMSPSIQIFSECIDFSDLQNRVTGQSINKGTVSEGRVYKSTSIPGLSFKCISNSYLLKAE
jgi:RNA ligase (TIGR02306 family)